ncbi:Nicotinamidase-related amidase [Modicisalibacter ilicicola DSM 19980]|uniref:Nicotinamidase-related amidase n=1 Tax=Modicisalibacter ilicicola DSM 19980 TaxID=1121942 RepID=A0A1M5BJA7_9GAMM|nr:cysteine hydrolase family protein [Halomonas ilicicola]SHF42367.1 Nicotinamidase-related amidase [Halomonas ilicicola DSM 19980]
MAAGSARLRLCDARDESAALVIIDVQQAIDDRRYWGRRNNPELEERLAELLSCWRAGNGHVVHVRHHSRETRSPYRAGQPGAEFKSCVAPRDGERVVTKHVNSAFVGTELEVWLRRHGVSHLVIAGVATAHSVSTTVRHAACLDFSVSVPEDACAGFEVTSRHQAHWSAETVHDLSLALLDGEYAHVTTTHEVVQHF